MTHPQQQLIDKWRAEASYTSDRGFALALIKCARDLEAALSAGAVPQLDLEPIKAREAAASKGPWRSMAAGNCSMEDGRLAAIAEVEGLPRPWNPVWVGWQNAKNYFKTFLRQADAEFIAHARWDVPMLIAEIERLRAGAVPQQEPQDWQPIETAKADVKVLLWTPRERLTDLPEHIAPCIRAEMRVSEPRYWTWATHWKPLPDPPPAVPALPAPQEQDGK
jgi:hypothetical protein